MIDESLRWSLNLARFDAHTRAQIISILARMEKELANTLTVGKLTDWGKARVNSLTAESRAIVAGYYTEIQAAMKGSMEGLIPLAASSVKLSTELGVALDVALPTEAMVKAIMSDSIIMGATQKAWWARQEANTAFRFTAAVRQGIMAAETNQQIIRRVRAEMQITRRGAASLVQTSVHTVANEARLATFKANSDVVTGLRWLATLDSHTCAQCGSRDGMTWKLDGTPIVASQKFLNPPIHFNDRCVLVPITRFSDMGSGQRASDRGPVDRKVTFEEFLGRQDKAYQEEVLGKGRTELWKSGKITLADLTSGNGRPLTLDQLKDKSNG